MPKPPVSGSQAIPMPNLEELKFWLDIMQEHALFIKTGLPCDQGEWIREADTYYEELGNLKRRANKVSGDKKFMELISDTQCVIAQFHHFKNHLVHLMLTCCLPGNNPPLMLDHMAREAEYVLKLLDFMKCGKPALQQMSKLIANVFWLRVMEDHTQFIRGRVDPSERGIINTVDEFATAFDDLFLQARDFASMLHHRHHDYGKPHRTYRHDHAEMPAYNRFVQDVRVATTRLRDFKKAAHKMIEDCKIVSIIPAALADHVRREADHFLMVLAMMDKGMLECGPEEEYQEDMMNCEHDYMPHHQPKFEKIEYEEDCMEPQPPCESEDEDDIEQELDECLAEDEDYEDVEFLPPAPVKQPKYAVKQKMMKEKMLHEKMVQEKAVKKPVPPKFQLDEDCEEDLEDKPVMMGPEKTAKSKFKWGGTWPRPLGKMPE